MDKAARPAIFKQRQTEPVFILCAVRRHLRYSLSLRDVRELLVERGPELDQRLCRHLKPTRRKRCKQGAGETEQAGRSVCYTAFSPKV